MQGSLMAISNMAGAVVEERNYDAWGRPRNPTTLAYTLPNPFGGATSNYTLRGYTFHEHLDMFDLINMNGRMYDTHLGIFLNADPLLQDPTNVQNYNRNSYVLNNPLKYTDPSGYASKGFAMPTFGGGFEPGENEQTNSWNRWQNAKKSLRALAEDALSHEIEGGGGGVGVFFMALTSGTIIRNNNSAENFVSNYYSFRSMLNFNSSLFNSINSAHGGIESLIRYVNSQPNGFIMTGDDIAARNRKLDIASNFVNGIEKVNGGIKVDFSWAGNLAVKASPHSIPDGTIFKVQDVLMNDKLPAIQIIAPGATLFGEPFNVYLRGDTYSQYGFQFYPIFKK